MESPADFRSALRVDLDRAVQDDDRETRERSLEAVAWNALDIDLALAGEAFAELGPGGTAAKRLAGHHAMRLAEEDPAAALEWVHALESPDEQCEAISMVAMVIAARDRQRALSVLDAVPECEAKDRATVQLSRCLAEQHPVAAAAWITTLRPGATRMAAIKEVFPGWLDSDPPGMAAWMTAACDEVRIEAVFVLSRSLAELDPVSLDSKLLRLENEEIRRQIENLLAQWPR